MSEANHNHEQASDSAEMKSSFSLWKILLPVLIGVAVVAWLFYKDAKQQNISEIWSTLRFTPHLIGCLALSWLFMIGRDLGLVWRFRALTDKDLSWKQALKVSLLCEFTSCVTPSAVGGSSMGMVFMNTEGIEFGRATTLMFTTLFLDELFFVVSCPIIVLLTPIHELFGGDSTGFALGLQLTFWIVYAIITLWTFLLFMGIIVKPIWIHNLLVKIFSIRWLRKWRPAIEKLGDNMVATGASLRKKSARFWVETFGGTALTWISRYLVVNALFLAFAPEQMQMQWLIFAMQFVVWVVLMACPTPGGSGVSEWLFTEYYGALIPTAGLALIMAICWRIISYYVYLLIGAVMVPKWLKDSIDKYKKREHK